MNPRKRILIISNNTLSSTSNNGKTVLSLFEGYPKNLLFQLFTRNEIPTIEIGGYFRITNGDIIKGKIFPNKRGASVEPTLDTDTFQFVKTSRIKRNSFSCLIREIIWARGWQSRQLDKWIDSIKPEIIFFVAGDTGYSYSICEYIASRSGAKINVYITDDYIIPRSKETVFDIIKRVYIHKKLNSILVKTKSFFTISEKMRKEYEMILHKDSMPIFNFSENLCMPIYANNLSENNTIVYAGSLYYGRDNILHEVAQCVSKLNKKNGTNVFLEIYSGQDIPIEIKNHLSIHGASEFCGALNKTELNLKFNKSGILLFVESFDKEQMEKTRLSFSTKIPEYLSTGKPILAIGPKQIGSMEFLKDVALCIDDTNKIEDALFSLVFDYEKRNLYALRAREKYESMGSIQAIRESFIRELCT